MIRLFNSSGNYRIMVRVFLGNSTCHECREVKDVLSFDSSEDEYTPSKFCMDCLNKFSKGTPSIHIDKYDDIREI